MRVLAGLLNKRCGLLPHDKLHFFSKAYHHYEKRRTETGEPPSSETTIMPFAAELGSLVFGTPSKRIGYFRPLGLPNSH